MSLFFVYVYVNCLHSSANNFQKILIWTPLKLFYDSWPIHPYYLLTFKMIWIIFLLLFSFNYSPKSGLFLQSKSRYLTFSIIKVSIKHHFPRFGNQNSHKPSLTTKNVVMRHWMINLSFCPELIRWFDDGFDPTVLVKWIQCLLM